MKTLRGISIKKRSLVEKHDGRFRLGCGRRVNWYENLEHVTLPRMDTGHHS